MQDDAQLLAILGPTNTGKTYLAFERLISHKSGIFGFPLRLLARENYDKAVTRLGIENVALITGEEKIIPKKAKYFFCTVESMPLNISVECIAIDEVQLAAHYERGHIFTDRIINLRGEFETILLGSLSIEAILIRLFPNINIQKRDRFSKLSFLAKNSLSKLNPRSAIIAFSINSVYEIAESIRMYKGGAAVVLGSLSPRTRNAQVEMYEDKKVDYLVATDAIGMGLNLNINHVSFSALQKFDGRYNRDLSPTELGQIAGRAGRYKNDGTFGYLKKAGSIDPSVIQSIENHKFDNINKIYWRNSNIDFSSIVTVINSFKKFPTKNFFIHKKNAEDEINFKALSGDNKIKKYLDNKKIIILLWKICQIPDFQKIFNDSYLALLKNIFLTLIENEGIFPEIWLQEKILKLENYKGGVEELTVKIANIRTWTYISSHSEWIKDYKFWQQKTHDIENNLSDYLHKSLTSRFVDSSASFFLNSKNSGEQVKIEVDEKKSIKLNGQNYGYINGFNLELIVTDSDSLFSLSHVKKSIRLMIEEKINNFLKAPKDSINFGDIRKLSLDDEIKIYWGDEPIGRLKKGLNIFSPKAESLTSEFLESNKRLLITNKLQEWLDEKILNNLKPISEPIDNTISSELRAVIFNLFNSLGSMLTVNYSDTVKNLNEHDRAIISKSGIRIGAKFFFMPSLLKKYPMELNALLWNAFYGSKFEKIYPLPENGRVSFESKVDMPDTYWLAIGYKYLDNFVVRIDVFERIFYLARQKSKYGPFLESSDLMNPIGCNSDQLEKILSFCGFGSTILNDDKKLFFVKLKNPLNLKKIVSIDKKTIFNIKKIVSIDSKKTFNIKKIASIDNKKTFNIKKVVNNNKQTINVKKINKTNSKKIINNINSSEKKIEKDPNSPFAILEKLL